MQAQLAAEAEHFGRKEGAAPVARPAITPVAAGLKRSVADLEAWGARRQVRWML